MAWVLESPPQCLGLSRGACYVWAPHIFFACAVSAIAGGSAAQTAVIALGFSERLGCEGGFAAQTAATAPGFSGRLGCAVSAVAGGSAAQTVAPGFSGRLGVRSECDCGRIHSARSVAAQRGPALCCSLAMRTIVFYAGRPIAGGRAHVGTRPLPGGCGRIAQGGRSQLGGRVGPRTPTES